MKTRKEVEKEIVQILGAGYDYYINAETVFALLLLMEKVCKSVIPTGDSPIPKKMRENFETMEAIVVAYKLIRKEIELNIKKLFK